jgi:AcrR family transcriptional regulator
MGNGQTSASVQAGRVERRKARTRAAILHAASQLFRERGFDSTSIQDIAEAADTGVGTLYGHFPSKEEILREVLTTHYAEAVEQFRAAVRTDSPALDRLCVALAAFGAYLRENRTILLAAFRIGMLSHPDESPSNWLGQACRQLIAEGIARGEIRDVPVGATVRLLMGTYTMAMLGIGGWHGHEDDAKTVYDLETLARAMLSP